MLFFFKACCRKDVGEREVYHQGEDLSRGHKCKYMMIFTAEDHAKVGMYTAENGVAKEQKHFKQFYL